MLYKKCVETFHMILACFARNALHTLQEMVKDLQKCFVVHPKH